MTVLTFVARRGAIGSKSHLAQFGIIDISFLYMVPEENVLSNLLVSERCWP